MLPAFHFVICFPTKIILATTSPKKNDHNKIGCVSNSHANNLAKDKILIAIPISESKEMVWAKWRNQFGRWYVLYEIVQTLDTIKVFPKLRLKYPQWKEMLKAFQSI